MYYRILVALASLWSLHIWAGDAGQGDLLGPVSSAQILAIPEFREAFQGYDPEQPAAADLAAVNGIQLVVLFGSWCHDSAREVPRLLKSLPATRGVTTQFIAIDRDKAEPRALVESYQLRYTPTVIALRGGVEVGRIIEQPEGSWLSHLARLAR
jgi:thioredoxin 1